MGKNWDFNESEEEFRLRVAEAIADGVDPLDYLAECHLHLCKSLS